MSQFALNRSIIGRRATSFSPLRYAVSTGGRIIRSRTALIVPVAVMFGFVSAPQARGGASDLGGANRVLDDACTTDTGSGAFTYLDIGAYELQIKDTDSDGVPDGCDVCPDFNDTLDTDGDGVPDGCDIITVPADLSPGDQYRLVFVTDAIREGTSSDIADYNLFVASDVSAVAQLTDLGTTFTAIASTAAVDARDNTMTDPTPAGSTGVPIYRLDGMRVADDYDQLWAGNVPGLFAPVSVTPTGVVLPGGNRSVWTGTVLGGTGPDGEELGNGNPWAGDAAATNASWVGSGPSGDSLKARNGLSLLFCYNERTGVS